MRTQTQMQKVMRQSDFNKRLKAARLIPSCAHLPSFGLMAPRNWNYEDPKLIKMAAKILSKKKITGVVYQTAPALFWYRTSDGDIHLHTWTND